MKYISSLISLKKLDLSNTRITDEGVRHLAKLELLETLDLSCTGLHGSTLFALSDLPISSLSLSTTELEDDNLKYLSHFRHLEILAVSICYRVTDDGAVFLQSLCEVVSSMKTLDIRDTMISSEGYALIRQHNNVHIIYDCAADDFLDEENSDTSYYSSGTSDDDDSDDGDDEDDDEDDDQRIRTRMLRRTDGYVVLNR